MHELAKTTYGRLLSVGIFLALSGGGLGSLDKGATGVAVMCISLIVGLAVAFVAVALAVRSSMPFAIGGVIVLPYLFFLFVVGLAVARHDHAVWAGYLFTGLGIVFGLNALFGTLVLGPHTRHDLAPAH